jgi:5-methyltetrahydrofolate--homocysteine methyltransferase
MTNRFLDLLAASDGPIIADGGMGTMLMAVGLLFGDPPEQWNVLPEKQAHIRAIHRGYLDAGAQIILTNTFGGSPFRLKLHNLHGQVFELNRAAAELARSEAGDRVVAGDIGPSGELFEPMGTLTYDAAVAGFAAQAAGLAAGGVDLLWIETMSDLNEVRAAVAGARQAAPDLPVVATMTFDTRGFTMMGVSPAEAVAALVELGLAAGGGNCGNGPDEIEGVIHGMRTALGTRGQGMENKQEAGSPTPNPQPPTPGFPLIAKSNAGMPEIVDGRAVYSGTPEVMAGYARRVRALGADIIGACCGSTPAHIRAMAQALRELPALSVDDVALASAPAQRQAPGAAQRAREERRARRGA